MATMQVTQVTVEGFTFLVDPAGFPVVECRRCSARGTIAAYSNTHHGVCYDCHGAGHQHPKGHAAGDLAREWYSRREERPLDGGMEMAPGMLLRRNRSDAWRELAERTPTGLVADFPGGRRWVEYRLTFTDGSTALVLAESWQTIAADNGPVREGLALCARQKWAARLRRQATPRKAAPVAAAPEAAEVAAIPAWMC